MATIEILKNDLADKIKQIKVIEQLYGEQYVPESLKTKRDDLRLQINSMEIAEQRIQKSKDFRDNLAETLGFVRMNEAGEYRSNKSIAASDSIVIKMTVDTSGKIRVYIHTKTSDFRVFVIDPETCKYNTTTGSDFVEMELENLIKTYIHNNILDVIDIKYMIDSIKDCLDNSRAARESKLHE
jgi:transcription termination factor Rho